jgi:hypothetical protein
MRRRDIKGKTRAKMRGEIAKLCLEKACGCLKFESVRIVAGKRGANPDFVIARSGLSAVAQRAKAEATKQSRLRHSGMVRSTRPGISRFRVRCFASPRNDGAR